MIPYILLGMIYSFNSISSLAIEKTRTNAIESPVWTNHTQPEIPVDSRVQSDILSVASKIKEFAVLRLNPPPSDFMEKDVVPISYRRQPRPSAGGIMDFVKVRIGDHIFHVGVFRGRWVESATLIDVRGPVLEKEPIYAFDCPELDGECTVYYKE